MIKIRYSNPIDVAGICYSSNFVAEVYLDVDVGKPSYIYTEEGDEKPDGSFERTFARVEKQYKIDTYLQEFLVDAFSVMQMHEDIEVWLSNGNIIPVDELRMSEPDWDDLRGLAAVTITFVVYEEATSNKCEQINEDCPTFTKPTLGGTKTTDDPLTFALIGTTDDDCLIEVYAFIWTDEFGEGDYELIDTVLSTDFIDGISITILDETTLEYCTTYQFKVKAVTHGCEDVGVFSDVFSIPI